MDFFHGGTEGDGTLETQGEASVSTGINHLAISQSPICGSLECFPGGPMEEPDFHRQHPQQACHCASVEHDKHGLKGACKLCKTKHPLSCFVLFFCISNPGLSFFLLLYLISCSVHNFK